MPKTVTIDIPDPPFPHITAIVGEWERNDSRLFPGRARKLTVYLIAKDSPDVPSTDPAASGSR